MGYRLSFRSKGSLAAFWFTALAVIVFVAVVLTTDGSTELLRALPLGGVILIWAWWRWEWPTFFAYIDSSSRPTDSENSSAGGLVIRNQIKTIRVPWSAVRGFSSRFGLFVIVSEGGDNSQKEYFVAAVPSNSGMVRRAAKPTPAIRPLGGKQVIWDGPLVASRLLEDELFYQSHPIERPPLPAVSASTMKMPEFSGVLVKTNWLPLILQTLSLVAAIATLLVR